MRSSSPILFPRYLYYDQEPDPDSGGLSAVPYNIAIPPHHRYIRPEHRCMKISRLPTFAAAALMSSASLAASSLLQFKQPPKAELHAAYMAMKAAVDENADEYAAGEMKEARARYVLAWQYKDDDPDAAKRLAAQSQVLAELAQAKTEATVAEQQRKAAQAEVTTLEQMARPAGSKR
jgi:hypothetical protein